MSNPKTKGKSSQYRKEVNMNKTKYVERARSAINGQYVSIDYANKHPKTTVIEKDKMKK